MLILASSSPRRTELLTAAGIKHIVITREVAETAAGEPEAVVIGNAKNKARVVYDALKSSVFHYEYKNSPILGADTVVVLDGKIFGKPHDEADARRILTELSGRTHRVYTGICLIDSDGIEYAAADMTEVTFLPLNEVTLQRYLKSGEYEGKAGAYAIQGRAMAFVGKINGSAANVIGLPVHTVIKLAVENGIEIYED